MRGEVDGGMASKMLATSGAAQYAWPFKEAFMQYSQRRLPVSLRTLAALALVALPTTLSGQSPSEPLREWMFVSVGAGAASVSASCRGCNTYFFADRAKGVSWHLMAGGSATDRLVIGGEISGWAGNEPPVFRRALSVNVVFRGYLRSDSRLFVKGGAGAIRVIARDDDNDTKTDAWLLHAGLGYDFPAGRNGLTAYATYQWSPRGTTWVNGFLSTNTILPRVVQVGLAYSVF